MLRHLASNDGSMDSFKRQVASSLGARRAQVQEAAQSFQSTTASAARQLVRDLDLFTYETPARYKAKFDAIETTSKLCRELCCVCSFHPVLCLLQWAVRRAMP